MKKIFLLLTLIVLLSGISIAQPSASFRSNDTNDDSTTVAKTKYNSWDAAIMLGMENYYGDFVNTQFFPGGTMKGKLNWNAGLKVKYNLSRFFGFQGNFSMGRMAADEESTSNYFETKVTDFDLGVFINLTTLLAPKKYNKRWYWDININYGGLNYDAELFDNSDNSLGTAGEFHSSISAGSELSYRITDKLHLGLDLKVISTGQDLLDVVHKGRFNDSYGHLSILLGYTFGKQAEAYRWNPMDDELKEVWDAITKNSDDIDTLEQRVAKLEAYHGLGAEELPDDDNDSVPNVFDLSPDTPEGTMVNFQGIPIPIQDTTEQGGCDCSTAPGSTLISIFFDYNRSIVSRSDFKELASVAQYLNSDNDAKVKIVGHTDSHGGDEYNKKLSEKRCDAVVKILTEGFGIDKSRLKVVGKGKSSILSEKYDDVNRRVDIVVE